MALFPEIDPDKLSVETEKAMFIPIGAASPLWAAYAGAASMGMAWWWMNQFAKPVNLEGFYGGKAFDFTKLMPEVPDLPVFNPFAEMLAAMQLEPAPLDPDTRAKAAPILAAVEPVTLAAEAVAETTAAMTEAMVEDAETVAEAAEEAVEVAASAEPNDLTVLTGIGPTLASKLAALGVTRFEQIAAWTAADIETFDKQLKLMGRVTRENWIDQAKQLANV